MLHTGRAIVFQHIFHGRMMQALRKAHQYLPKWLLTLKARRTVAYLSAQDMGIALTDHMYWAWNENTLTKQPFAQVSPLSISHVSRLTSHDKPKPHTPLSSTSSSASTSPASSFNDITVAQFEDAHVIASIFHTTKEVKHLQMLARILYSVSPSQYHTLPHAEDPGEWKQAPVENLFLIYQWFTACHSQLANQFTKVFSTPKSPRASARGDSDIDLTAFTKLVHSAAGSELGTLTQVRQLPLKAFLFHIQHQPEPTKPKP